MDKNQIREFVYKYDSSITRYEAYYYGYPEIADELCRLVMEGEKRATTGLLKLYELENEPLPREGDYSVILDSREQPRCITRISRVTQVKFSDITEEYARCEGGRGINPSPIGKKPTDRFLSGNAEKTAESDSRKT